MVRRGVLVGVLLSSAGVAHAGDKPLYQPVPSWVKPAPPIDTKTLTSASPAVLVTDVQARISDGTSWTYYEQAVRPTSLEALSKAGTVTVNWNPAHGDLIVHGVDILRDGQRIDALQGKQFTVLRREQGLENMTVDGTLTATLAVEGLRVGDVLDVRISGTVKDATLQGNAEARGPLISQPVKIGFARTRLLWPTGAVVHWKAYPEGATPAESDSGGWHELVFTQPLPRQPDPAPDAPGRFTRPPVVDASTFADWAAVSKVMAPLYRTEGLIAPGSPLAQEVARIAAAEKDPRHRVAAAVALVQERVRYLMNGMNNGNLVPQKPADTWSLRYGDCKAKTLLLLAILHELGIEAEPALANLGQGDLVAARLPSAGAFNHVFVLAKVGGEQLWLEGTATGTHYEDLGDVPAYRWVLPLRNEGASLLAAPNRAPARPMVVVTGKMDARGGVNLPAPFDVQVELHGAAVGAWKAFAANADKDALRNAVRQFTPRPFQRGALTTSANITFDDKAGTALIRFSGISMAAWQYGDRRYNGDFAVVDATRLPDRSRAIWKTIPVATGDAGRRTTTIQVMLPQGGKDFAIDGKPAVDLDKPGGHVTAALSLDGDTLTVRTEESATGAEIPPTELSAVRVKLAELQNQKLKVRTAVGYPGRWRTVGAAKQAHLYDVTLQRLADFVAERPDEAARYATRGSFLDLIFERKQALADYDKAIAIDASVKNLLARATIRASLGDKKGAIADLEAARDQEPGNVPLLARLTMLMAEAGQKDDALALLDPRIDEGGENLPALLSAKATVLARAGEGEAALAALDKAIADKPDDGALRNDRCWIAGTMNFALEDAMKHCNRAIELGGQDTANALDSRAMVYFRLNRLDQSLNDLNAALDQRQGAAASLYMRGVVEMRLGKKSEAAADLADARLLNPEVDTDYARWGIKP
ncbi:DUF3857 domain-containing protein [uncultured Sphingomonas sp.]|uniref:DUF3857 domain-containing protein n=1 Tax=uncultured Sphingomonas sp. TaxID=158754 RepID=UPI0025E0E95F|nr:DUF3857 domain-containing protein [uncultured Sphingomonas sp.]